jgi:hypothetical protein
MRNEIYYLYDLHRKCMSVAQYYQNIISKYCDFVNLRLKENFSSKEQKQLKLNDFDSNKLY